MSLPPIRFYTFFFKQEKNKRFIDWIAFLELRQLTTAVDIYSLGMVTLEVNREKNFFLLLRSIQMINLDLGGNGDMHSVTDEMISEAIQSLENPLQKVTNPFWFNRWSNFSFCFFVRSGLSAQMFRIRSYETSDGTWTSFSSSSIRSAFIEIVSCTFVSRRYSLVMNFFDFVLKFFHWFRIKTWSIVCFSHRATSFQWWNLLWTGIESRRC